MSNTFEDQGGVATDCNQLYVQLVERLGTLSSGDPTESVYNELVDVVNQLFALLPIQFDRKGADGYLHEVTEKYPSWDEQVELLQVEQALLYEDLREIRDKLELGIDPETTVSTVAPLLRDWLARLDRHEHEERRLTQVAMNLDVGGQGG